MPQVEGFDPRVELAVVDRPDHHVVGARLEQADPLLDVVARRDGEDRDLRERRQRAHLAADVGEGERTGRGVEHHHVLVRRDRGELLRVVDPGQDPARAAEDLDERVARGVAEQQDSSVGHGSPCGHQVMGAARGYNPPGGAPAAGSAGGRRDPVLDSAA